MQQSLNEMADPEMDVQDKVMKLRHAYTMNQISFQITNSEKLKSVRFSNLVNPTPR